MDQRYRLSTRELRQGLKIGIHGKIAITETQSANLMVVKIGIQVEDNGEEGGDKEVGTRKGFLRK
jgi:hypothetical protein